MSKKILTSVFNNAVANVVRANGTMTRQEFVGQLVAAQPDLGTVKDTYPIAVAKVNAFVKQFPQFGPKIRFKSGRKGRMAAKNTELAAMLANLNDEMEDSEE